MKKKLILLLFIPFALSAQDNPQDSIHQNIIMSVLEHINAYESASSFANENRITQFRGLFVDSSSTNLVNDIPAIGSYDEILSLDEYESKMRKHYSRIGVDITINEISSINFEDNTKGSLSVFLTKRVYGKNARNKIVVTEKNSDNKKEKFDEYVRYKDEFELEFRFVFENGSIRISEIKLREPKGKLLVIAPHWTTLWNKASKKDLIAQDEMKLKIRNQGDQDWKELQLSGYYYSIPDIDFSTNIEIASNDRNFIGKKNITLKKYEESGKDHLYKIPFNKTIGDLKLFGILNFNSLKPNANIYNVNITENKAQSYGLSLSLNLDNVFFRTKKVKEKQKFSVYIKGGVIKDDFDYDINIPTYTETYSDIDIDGGAYERTVLLENFKETQVLDMLTGFVQAEFRAEAPKNWAKWAQGGISASVGFGKVNIKSAKYDNSAEAKYSGYYQDLFGITIAENGVYNFGDYSIENSGDLEHNTDVQTLLIDVGILYTINDRLFMDGTIMYTNYQTNIFNIGAERVSHESTELNTINNLVDVDMSHLSFKVGINYKL